MCAITIFRSFTQIFDANLKQGFWFIFTSDQFNYCHHNVYQDFWKGTVLDHVVKGRAIVLDKELCYTCDNEIQCSHSDNTLSVNRLFAREHAVSNDNKHF